MHTRLCQFQYLSGGSSSSSGSTGVAFPPSWRKYPIEDFPVKIPHPPPLFVQTVLSLPPSLLQWEAVCNNKKNPDRAEGKSGKDAECIVDREREREGLRKPNPKSAGNTSETNERPDCQLD